jgi:hypothetical protein
MADIASLRDAIEDLKLEFQSSGGQQITFLDAISADMSEMAQTSTSMLEELRLLREAMVGDPFSQAQERENQRENSGVTPTPEQSPDIQPIKPDTKGGMSLMGKLALGAGAAAGLIAAVGAFLDFDADAVKSKVKTLMSIQDDMGGALEFFAEGATFGATMAGIGIGLAAFGVGQSAVAFAQFASEDDWAMRIKNNVATLMSIDDVVEANGDSFIGDSATFLLAMTGIGLGLAALSAGQAVNAISDFTSDDQYAQKIKDNVTTLMSIEDVLGGSANFIGDSATFLLAMTGIGAGLAAFSAGQAASAVAQFMSSEDWTGEIKENVEDLLSIVDGENVSLDKVQNFDKVMGGISLALAKFAGAKFLDSLSNVASGIMNFLSGSESPIQEMMNVANNADELEKGAGALERIGDALGKISDLNFDGSNLNMEALAEDLLTAIPVIEKAIMGGTVEKFGLFNDVEIKGLASPDIKYEEATKRIRDIQIALNPVAASSAPKAEEMTFSGRSGASATYQVSEVSNQNQQMKNSTNVVAPVTQVVAPQTVNNASSTTIAPRNPHSKSDLTELYF